MFYICYKVRGWRSLGYWMIYVQGLMLCCLLASSLHNSFSNNSSPGSSFPTFFRFPTTCMFWYLTQKEPRSCFWVTWLGCIGLSSGSQVWLSMGADAWSHTQRCWLNGNVVQLGHWVNVTHIEVSAAAWHGPELNWRALQHMGQGKQQIPLDLAQASLALPSSQEHNTYPVATSCFLLLSSTLVLKSKCNSRKMRTQNDNSGIGFVWVGRFQGLLVNSEDPVPFHLDCALLILVLLGDFPELNWKLKMI